MVVQFTRYISVLMKVRVCGKIFWIYTNYKKDVLFRHQISVRTYLISHRMYSDIYLSTGTVEVDRC